MSTASYRFGEMIGTALRECMRAFNQKPTTAPVPAPAAQCRSIIEPALTNSECEALCSVPAMVRRKGIDLHDWYEANSKECKPAKKSRKRIRPSKQTTDSVAKQDDVASQSPKLGSLDQLIA